MNINQHTLSRLVESSTSLPFGEGFIFWPLDRASPRPLPLPHLLLNTHTALTLPASLLFLRACLPAGRLGGRATDWMRELRGGYSLSHDCFRWFAVTAPRQIYSHLHNFGNDGLLCPVGLLFSFVSSWTSSGVCGSDSTILLAPTPPPSTPHSHTFTPLSHPPGLSGHVFLLSHPSDGRKGE